MLSNALIFVVPLIISIVNYVSKLVLVLLSAFEKHQSFPEHIYKSAINMMICSVLNTAGVILLVNFNIEKELPIPILQGSYKEFSVEWYKLVGSTICMQMIFMIFTPHLANYCF
jgi:hypothetical protein